MRTRSLFFLLFVAPSFIDLGYLKMERPNELDTGQKRTSFVYVYSNQSCVFYAK